jgi:hypothetical protein
LEHDPIEVNLIKNQHEIDLWVEKFKPADFFDLLSDDVCVQRFFVLFYFFF